MRKKGYKKMKIEFGFFFNIIHFVYYIIVLCFRFDHDSLICQFHPFTIYGRFQGQIEFGI